MRFKPWKQARHHRCGTNPSWNSPMHAALQRIVISKSVLARDVIYISRLCHDASPSVCPSVCDGSALAHYS